ncbi:MAG: hypothetical protein ACLQDM_05960 [Bradyrhizobium sp.]
MRAVFCSRLLITLVAIPALAGPISANANTPAFTYRSSGTCLASPLGFSSKLEPVNSGIAWTTTFTSAGSVDDHGAATEIGQAVDTASFGAGPRMHTPAAHAYEDRFTVAITDPGEGGGVTFHAGTISGTFTAGPYAGRSFSLSGFELKKAIGDHGFDVYGSATSPVVQTLSLDGIKFERVCVLTVSTSPQR